MSGRPGEPGLRGRAPGLRPGERSSVAESTPAAMAPIGLRWRSSGGFGMPTVIALCLPVIILIGALALSYQSSTARRFTAKVWMGYVGLEMAESAVAVAAHFLKPEHVFDPAIFGPVGSSPTFVRDFLEKLVKDDFPNLDSRFKEYRDIKDSSGKVVHRMLVAIRFPEAATPVRIDDQGLLQRIVKENPGVRFDSADDLAVTVRPLSFRREYRRDFRDGNLWTGWVNWGVVQFRVKVRVNDLKGTTTHELRVDRRFTLRLRAKPGQERMMISSLNLRTMTNQEDL